MKKKILILAGSYQHCKLVKAAKELGLYTIVTDNVKNSPAKRIADQQLDIDVFDVNAIVEFCRREKVDAVLSTHLEASQRTYQKVCELLNLPCYCNEMQSQIMTDKEKFKQFCREHNVDTIPAYSVEAAKRGDPENTIEYPVLVKPARSRGSRGQSVCNNLEELRAGIAKAEKESWNGNALIEKYMAGYRDFAVSYLFVNGEGYVTRTTDRYLGSPNFGLNSVTIGTASPSCFTKKYMENVHPRVVNMFKAMGITDGPVFMQGFIDGDTVRFYDPGLRFPGSEYDVMFIKLTKVDIIKMLVNYAVTGLMKPDFGEVHNQMMMLGGKQTFTLCPTVRQGTIASINGIDEIASFPEVETYAIRSGVGEVIPPNGDTNNRLGEFDLIANNFEEIGTAIRRIQKTLSVLDTDGTEMLVNPLDFSLVRIKE